MNLPQFLDNPFQIKLSFHRVIERLEKEAAAGEGLFVNTLLHEVSTHPELREGITDIEQITQNADLIARLLAELFPASLTLNEIKAVSIPYQGLLFNHTERFNKLLESAGPGFEVNIRNFDDHQFYVFSCCLILNQFYDMRIDFSKPLFYDIPNKEGFLRHYRILYNADFLEIAPLGDRAKLSREEIRVLMNSYDNLALWKEKFPPGSWLMKGFALVTLVDVTVENAVSLLKGDLLSANDDPDLHLKLADIFKSIFRITEVRVGFTSYDELNGKFRNVSLGKEMQSFILPVQNDATTNAFFCKSTYESLIRKRTNFAVADTDAFLLENPDSQIALNFQALGIQSFIIAPVIKNDSLLGFLELASPNAADFNSVNANKLDTVMPFLVDTIDRKVSEFKNRLQAVIQSNYTTLHPSVNWKFEREAHNFIHTTDAGHDYHLKEIKFQNVFPLYGQVDIQNSSITRNESVRNDLEEQIGQLIALLEQRPDLQNGLALLTRLKVLAGELAIGIKADTEQSVQNFLDLEVHPLLRIGMTIGAASLHPIENYFAATDKLIGSFYANRRNYDQTLALINNKLVEVLDKRHEEIQQYFPHYYERFKTDGVEHNLYIGESIFPDHHFGPAMLNRLRLWQMLVIAEMAIAQYALKKVLPYPLSVTNLMLVFSTPIDIRFRMDEKHFDLDGAYNIRYEVIKKRIDKAHIKGTESRITAKEKLTIVYAKEEEQLQYRNFISILQNAGILTADIEAFDIEDLQGVAGLKALRVGINNDIDLLPAFSSFYELAYQQLDRIS